MMVSSKTLSQKLVEVYVPCEKFRVNVVTTRREEAQTEISAMERSILEVLWAFKRSMSLEELGNLLRTGQRPLLVLVQHLWRAEFIAVSPHNGSLALAASLNLDLEEYGLKWLDQYEGKQDEEELELIQELICGRITQIHKGQQSAPRPERLLVMKKQYGSYLSTDSSLMLRPVKVALGQLRDLQDRHQDKVVRLHLSSGKNRDGAPDYWFMRLLVHCRRRFHNRLEVHIHEPREMDHGVRWELEQALSEMTETHFYHEAIRNLYQYAEGGDQYVPPPSPAKRLEELSREIHQYSSKGEREDQSAHDTWIFSAKSIMDFLDIQKRQHNQAHWGIGLEAFLEQFHLLLKRVKRQFVLIAPQFDMRWFKNIVADLESLLSREEVRVFLVWGKRADDALPDAMNNLFQAWENLYPNWFFPARRSSRTNEVVVIQDNQTVLTCNAPVFSMPRYDSDLGSNIVWAMSGSEATALGAPQPEKFLGRVCDHFLDNRYVHLFLDSSRWPLVPSGPVESDAPCLFLPGPPRQQQHTDGDLAYLVGKVWLESWKGFCIRLERYLETAQPGNEPVFDLMLGQTVTEAMDQAPDALVLVSDRASSLGWNEEFHDRILRLLESTKTVILIIGQSDQGDHLLEERMEAFQKAGGRLLRRPCLGGILAWNDRLLITGYSLLGRSTPTPSAIASIRKQSLTRESGLLLRQTGAPTALLDALGIEVPWQTMGPRDPIADARVFPEDRDPSRSGMDQSPVVWQARSAFLERLAPDARLDVPLLRQWFRKALSAEGIQSAQQWLEGILSPKARLPLMAAAFLEKPYPLDEEGRQSLLELARVLWSEERFIESAILLQPSAPGPEDSDLPTARVAWLAEACRAGGKWATEGLSQAINWKGSNSREHFAMTCLVAWVLAKWGSDPAWELLSLFQEQEEDFASLGGAWNEMVRSLLHFWDQTGFSFIEMDARIQANDPTKRSQEATAAWTDLHTEFYRAKGYTFPPEFTTGQEIWLQLFHHDGVFGVLESVIEEQDVEKAKQWLKECQPRFDPEQLIDKIAKELYRSKRGNPKNLRIEDTGSVPRRSRSTTCLKRVHRAVERWVAKTDLLVTAATEVYEEARQVRLSLDRVKEEIEREIESRRKAGCYTAVPGRMLINLLYSRNREVEAGAGMMDGQPVIPDSVVKAGPPVLWFLPPEPWRFPELWLARHEGREPDWRHACEMMLEKINNPLTPEESLDYLLSRQAFGAAAGLVAEESFKESMGPDGYAKFERKLKLRCDSVRENLQLRMGEISLRLVLAQEEGRPTDDLEKHYRKAASSLDKIDPYSESQVVALEAELAEMEEAWSQDMKKRVAQSDGVPPHMSHMIRRAMENRDYSGVRVLLATVGKESADAKGGADYTLPPPWHRRQAIDEICADLLAGRPVQGSGAAWSLEGPWQRTRSFFEILERVSRDPRSTRLEEALGLASSLADFFGGQSTGIAKTSHTAKGFYLIALTGLSSSWLLPIVANHGPDLLLALPDFNPTLSGPLQACAPDRVNSLDSEALFSRCSHGNGAEKSLHPDPENLPRWSILFDYSNTLREPPARVFSLRPTFLFRLLQKGFYPRAALIAELARQIPLDQLFPRNTPAIDSLPAGLDEIDEIWRCLVGRDPSSSLPPLDMRASERLVNRFLTLYGIWYFDDLARDRILLFCEGHPPLILNLLKTLTKGYPAPFPQHRMPLDTRMVRRAEKDLLNKAVGSEQFSLEWHLLEAVFIENWEDTSILPERGINCDKLIALVQQETASQSVSPKQLNKAVDDLIQAGILKTLPSPSNQVAFASSGLRQIFVEMLERSERPV
ncbi:MAG: hypothetical protein HQL90_05955 [Magnetococcales bacterium]|nr:hypothetical protein [Magnetococcales bacterium]